MKAAVDHFTNRPAPEYKHLDLYIFVLKAEKGARIVSLAQARLLIDPGGLNISRAVLDKTTTKGAWVNYWWKDPLSRQDCAQVLVGVLHKKAHIRLRYPETVSNSH